MPYLEMRGIVKEFPGVRALDDMSFAVEKGKILALCGENGAGKSTLMKVLAGVYPAGEYSGEIVLDGVTRSFSGTKDAEAAGVAIIHQELNLFPELTVMENLFIGREESRAGVLDWVEYRTRAMEILNRFGLDLPVDSRVGDLRLGQAQVVEICRALAKDAKVLVLDEPTSALSEKEVALLFSIMRRLRESGVTMIYISHKMDELVKIVDEIAVIRDGKSVLPPTPVEKITREELVRAMVGRDVTNVYPRVEVAPGEELLAVKDFCVLHPLLPGEFLVNGIDFSVRAGEIYGIYGLMGSGRTETLTGIFHGFPSREIIGELRVAGRPVEIEDTAEAIRAGIALVTEDRKLFGLVLGLSIRENSMLASAERLSTFGVVDAIRERQEAQRLIKDLRIKTPSCEQFAGAMSGGNQQKVVLAKWLATSPKILLMDEPTRGVDIGAKHEIYGIMNRLKSEGAAIVMVTSELPELLGMSDRIMVMREGAVVGTFTRAEATAEKIGALATGIN